MNGKRLECEGGRRCVFSFIAIRAHGMAWPGPDPVWFYYEDVAHGIILICMHPRLYSGTPQDLFLLLGHKVFLYCHSCCLPGEASF